MKFSSDKCARSRGVTLLEMLVVLAILSMSIVLFAPMIVAGAEKNRGLRDAESIATALRASRADAIAANRAIDFIFDASERTYGIEGQKPFALSPGVTLEFTGARELMTPSGAGVIRLHSDGASSGGVVRIISKHESDVIEVDWLTGAVRLNRERRQ
ncbi:MAG: hypothetical protein A3E78_16640 [Alphaproteobacteria bacterium RIFCSPHIGHO2_12_FULL_63_12]|nr:MAG: hypothetical protein A3E78_16640 [Alphaproteobacteria bacterium RIFCSPHIGHO2_12_FULL_63_12]